MSMRFTSLKTTVSIVYDGMLEDEEVSSLLEELKTKELTCSMSIGPGPLNEDVRILAVNPDSTITWRMLKSGSSLKKLSPISAISAIEINTNEEILLKLKPEPSRWSIIDPSDN